MFNPSFWELESFYAPVDIVIAGAGLGGLWSAYYLKKRSPGFKILIIEKSTMPVGASTRNAGFACFGSLTELVDDAKTLGENGMLELVEMRYKGLSMLRKAFSKSRISYERSGGYELIAPRQYVHLEDLKRDIIYINKLVSKITGDGDTFRLADHKIDRFGFQGAAHLVQNSFEGQLHSGQLVEALTHKVQAMGVRIMPGVELKNMESLNESVVLQTNLPVDLSARQLLLCTNASTQLLLPNTDISPARGQVLVTSPIEGLPFRGCFHYDEGYYYFRNLGRRVLLGGARNMAFNEEHSTELLLTDTIQQELERFLQAMVLPNRPYTIDYRWSGIMGMGKDKLPTIQEVKPHIFCAAGMGGIGVALAPVIGKTVSRLMVV